MCMLNARSLVLPVLLALVCKCENVLSPRWMIQALLGGFFLLFHYSLSLELLLAQGSHL